jgi:Zn-dependent M28 family amino/carboxypeptidase
VFNGANDNASGTAALFALARHFSADAPAHSLVFAAFDAEESGLRGARAFVQSPPVERSSVALNLNMDMIGRDPDNILYVAGTHTQPQLKPIVARLAASVPVRLLMGHDDPAARNPENPRSVEDWTRSSDHWPFLEAGIPALYFGVEDFGNHHRATDKYESMTHDFYVRAVETMIAAVKAFDANLDEVVRRGAERSR